MNPSCQPYSDFARNINKFRTSQHLEKSELIFSALLKIMQKTQRNFKVESRSNSCNPCKFKHQPSNLLIFRTQGITSPQRPSQSSLESTLKGKFTVPDHLTFPLFIEPCPLVSSYKAYMPHARCQSIYCDYLHLCLLLKI